MLMLQTTTSAWQSLLPGIGTTLVAILSGAGGSAILELFWKPRRSKRRAAALIHADMILNYQLILAWAELRKSTPRKIPDDMILCRVGFDNAAGMIGDLPPELLRRLVGYYNRVDDLNRNLHNHSLALSTLESLDSASPRVPKLKGYLNSVIDVWNSGLDKVFETSQDLLPELEKIAKITAKKHERKRDIAAEARTLNAERAERLKRLAEMDDDEE